MAPFHQAIQSTYSRREGDTVIYTGVIDPEWVVYFVPQGGYVLALLVNACMHLQASTTHPDPVHVTAHYLFSSSVAPFEIHIRIIRKGKSWTNILADLKQNNQTIVSTHSIYGNLSTLPQKPTPPPPPLYTRTIPLHTHPATLRIGRSPREVFGFKHHISFSEDRTVRAKNSPTHPDRITSGGANGVEYGTWIEFVDREDKITPPSLALILDLFINAPLLIPKEYWKDPDVAQSWFPTMTMNIEFKSPIPRNTPDSPPLYASNTVGIYSRGYFINEPSSRHDMYTEVWTAPTRIGAGSQAVKEGWQSEQVCLATSTQMALVLPGSVNMRRGGGKVKTKL